MSLESVALRFDGERLMALDQRRLPAEEVWIEISDPDKAIEAIKTLAVRGAPLIGVAAALCLGRYGETSGYKDFETVAMKLRGARPTAVNLGWAIDRVLAAYSRGQSVWRVATEIFLEDQALCDCISSLGAALIPEGGILTHCNAGSLATAGVGTALGILKRAHRQGKKIHVYIDETRPLLQGARLTTWELNRAEIPHTLICDNMAAVLMRQEKVQMAVVGADRIAMNGDFANKIGTYSVAVNCSYHKVPLVVAAPRSTVDKNCKNGAQIPIEIRLGSEMSNFEVACWNPAFDVTPNEMVYRFVLDSGVYLPGDISKVF